MKKLFTIMLLLVLPFPDEVLKITFVVHSACR